MLILFIFLLGLKNQLKRLPSYESLDLGVLVREIMDQMLENDLERELEEQIDYRNKLTDKSRSGYSKKSLKVSSGIIDISFPRDRDNEFELQIIKKIKIQ